MKLNIRERGGLILAHIQNNFNGQLKIHRNVLETSKQSEEGWHDFRILSMQMICDKYSGHLAVSTDQDYFHLKLMIPVPEGQEDGG